VSDVGALCSGCLCVFRASFRCAARALTRRPAGSIAQICNLLDNEYNHYADYSLYKGVPAVCNPGLAANECALCTSNDC